MHRRSFLHKCGALVLGFGAPGIMLAATGREQRYFSARADLEGRYFISAMDGDGELLFDVPLPARAHAITARPGSSEILVFARRPGYFMLVVDVQKGAVRRRIDSSADRPLFGHGVFSSDGRYLFTSENAIDEGLGAVGVRDAADGYRRIDEFSSGGIGPHELRLLRDGKTLVVANGGILTHPDTGRSKLNLDSMRPSLSYIDIDSGKLIDDFRLPEDQHQLSIRHLDVNGQDQVCFAMQYQGPKSHKFPLVGFHRGEESLQLAEMPVGTLNAMKNYCGSVCADQSGEWFAVSAPRGNLVAFWRSRGEYAGSTPVEDGCGIAAGSTAGEFLLSSGRGELYRYRSGGEKRLLSVVDSHRWDNHMVGFRF